MLRSQAELHKDSPFAQAILDEKSVVQIQVSYGNGEGFEDSERSFPQAALSLRILHAYFAGGGHAMLFSEFNRMLSDFLGRNPYHEDLNLSTAFLRIRDDWELRFSAAKEAHMIVVLGVDEVQGLLDETVASAELQRKSLSTTVKAIGKANCSLFSGDGIFLVPCLRAPG